MIGTPNRYFPTSHSSFQSATAAEENNLMNEGSDDEQLHQPNRSLSNSPIDDKKRYSPFTSTHSGISPKELKDYNWPSTHRSMSYSTYDDNDNITNAPLNLSLNGNDTLESDVIKHATPQLLSLPNSTSVAQLILTSGQMVQGIQGAQLFVPTSQGLTKQIVLTIPITHVTTNQVINLSLRDGQIIPTTVGELLNMAMPKSIFEDDVTGDKIVNELMKLSEQTSLYVAEYLKSALKHSKKYYSNDSQRRSDSDGESVNEKDISKDEERETSPLAERPDTRPSAESTMRNHSFRKPVRSVEQTNGHDPTKSASFSRRKPGIMGATNVDDDSKSSLPTKHHRSIKRVNDTAVNYGDLRSHKMLNNRLSNDFPMHLLASEPIDKSLISAPVTREEPTSTMNHETERNYKFDNNNYRLDGSPSDSYDENDLDDIKEFAKSFKLRRLSMGLTQTQVGQALNVAEGPAYSQSAICSALASQVYAAQLASQQHSIFEKLDITPKSAQKIKPVLERWMKEAEERSGQGLLTEFIGMESSKKRKRRTSFTPQALEILNSHFEHNTHPSGTEITALAHQLGYDREVIRIWFCNKRQALKNTVRMMSKHMM